jgi:hypothetical protein
MKGVLTKAARGSASPRKTFEPYHRAQERARRICVFFLHVYAIAKRGAGLRSALSAPLEVSRPAPMIGTSKA